MASGRRVAKGDDFVLYLMALVIVGVGLVVALAYVSYLFVGLATFVFSVLSMGMG